MEKALVFDVETDGIGTFRPATHAVVQLAYVRGDQRWCVLICDVEEISDVAYSIHGIPLRKCKEEGVPFAEAVRGLVREMRRCDEVVGHNVEFDIGCVRHGLLARGETGLLDEFDAVMEGLRVFCTMKESVGVCALPKKGRSSRYPGYKYPSLLELHLHLFGDAPEEGQHDALNDCIITQRCYRALCEISHV